MTQGEPGRRVFVSGGDIGQFEQAIRKPQLDVAQRIDEVLQTDGFFERLRRKLIVKSPYAEYFAPVAELERLATRICEFAPTVVPGPEYRVTLHENVLRVAVGGAAVMTEQLRHVATPARRRAVLVTVIPGSAGPTPQWKAR